MPTNFDQMVDGAQENPAPVEDEIEPVEDGHSSVVLANFSTKVEFGSEDLVIPRLRLAQGLTGEVQDGSAKPGQWLLTGYPPADNLTIIPLLFSRNRALRDDAGGVQCRSTDSVVGIGTPGGVCSQCPMNTWADGPKGERIPPVCVFSYTYICYVTEHDTIAMIDFRRTSIQAGKTLNTIVAQRGIANFAVKLHNNKQQGKRGTFYQMVVQPVQVSAEMLEKARNFI